MHLIKLFKTYGKVKDIFVKPSLKVYFGKWRKDPNLPIWRDHIWRFRIFNWDVMYKHKWDEVRYEFPPQFSIVFFGLSLTITAHAPKTNDNNSWDDLYWESIINAAEKINCGPEEALKYAMEQGGFWYTPTNKLGYFSLRPDYIKDKYRALYNKELYRVANKVEEDAQ